MGIYWDLDMNYISVFCCPKKGYELHMEKYTELSNIKINQSIPNDCRFHKKKRELNMDKTTR